jgi:hypothetical protein
MRTEESASLRVLLIAVLLVGATIACVAFLVAEGVLRLTGTHALGGGVALLLVALLAATISALGPKYRPTPFLTPLTAGVFAALFATTVVYAAHTQVSTRGRTAVASEARVEPKQKAPPAVAPVVRKAEIPPERVDEPPARLFDASINKFADDRVPVAPAAALPPARVVTPMPAVATAPVDEKPVTQAPPVAVAATPARAEAPAKTASAPRTVPVPDPAHASRRCR